mmetsp:Transcript_33520/g.77282  ORF Transcript_33520/g.77282 Transcript_33520/m.77282 type:complete len:294 (+) Transcript_33520:45-926(+)
MPACEFLGADGPVVVADPYTTAGVEDLKFILLYVLAFLMSGMAVNFWSLRAEKPRNGAKPEVQLLAHWLYAFHFLISAMGYLLEAIGATAFTVPDGWTFASVGRMILVVGLAPLIAWVNAVAENLWPSTRWLELGFVWLFLLFAALVGIIVAQGQGLFVTCCIVATVHLYAAVVWLMATLRFPRHAGLSFGGTIFIIAAFLIWAFLETTCGPKGHEACYADCVVGHGFLHHVIFFGILMFGYILWWCAFVVEVPPELVIPDAIKRMQAWISQPKQVRQIGTAAAVPAASVPSA